MRAWQLWEKGKVMHNAAPPGHIAVQSRLFQVGSKQSHRLEQMKQMMAMSAREQIVAQLRAEALNLEAVKSEKIDPDAPLIREGLGLYSNDAFEQPPALFRQYAFKPPSDNKQNSIIFRSLRALSRHVEQSLTQ